MVTGIRSRGRLVSRRYRPTPYSLSSLCREIVKKDIRHRKKSKIALDKKDWEDAICSVCMEYPHNAVLLLCSSHEKGCRPYMCGTSYRYSNCLDQFKKAYTKATSPSRGHHWFELANNPSAGLGSNLLSEKYEFLELACPLCRGQVKGMTVVEPAREYLNAKMRACTQDDCSFNGTYKDLRKHVKQEHPFARPRKVDPGHEAKWRTLESEREHEDVLSTIQALIPRGRVFGDYVIEGGQYGFGTDDDEEEVDEDYGGSEVDINDPSVLNILFMYQQFDQAGTANLQSRLRRQRDISHIFNDIRERVAISAVTSANGASVASGFRGNGNLSLNGRRQGRMVGRERSERRRRRRSQRRMVLDGS